MTIKGQTDEDAVLCTADKTYTLRSVVLSNSVLVVTPPTTGSNEDIVIRDQLHEVLEAVPCIPKLQKLRGILRGTEYDEGHEDDDEFGSAEDDRPVRSSPRLQSDSLMYRRLVDQLKKRRCTYEAAQEILQASDVELKRGIRDQRVLLLNGTAAACTTSTS